MRRLFTVIFFLSAFLLAAADYHFTRISVLQGLSSNDVGAILADSRGFTWIGTLNGLNRFDGQTFKVFSHHRGDSTSIPGDHIYSLAEDKDGNIWIGTDAGIAKMNPWSEQATTLSCQPFPSRPGFPNAVYIDHAQHIWAWNPEGLWKYDQAKNAFLPQVNTKDECEGSSSFYQDSKGRYWICSYNGICGYDPVTKKLTKYHDAIGKFLVNSLFEDHFGNLWIGTWSHGIGRFFPESGTFLFYPWIDHPENPSIANIASTFAETHFDGQYQLWAATNAGLARISGAIPSKETVQFVHSDAVKPESIPSDQVNTVAAARDGQLWTGTPDGLGVLLPEHQLFQQFIENYNGQTIRVVSDGEERTFFCTWYGGLYAVDRNGKVLRHWTTIPEHGGQVGEHASDILRTADGSLWVATFDGLCRGDENGNSFRQILPVPGENSICDVHINTLAQDQQGNIWCGSYGKGLSILDPSGKWKTYTANSPNTPVSDNLVWEIFCDHAGNVWVGTNDGIGRMDAKSGKAQTWKYIINQKDTVRFGMAGAFLEGNDGTIWIGSNNGLFGYTPEGKFICYEKDDGLPANGIIGLCEDRQNKIWITTSNGLSRFDPSTKIFTNYSLSAGLPGINLQGDLHALPDGRIVIGLSNLVIAFDPARLARPVGLPSVFLMGIDISGKKVSYGENPSSAPTLESGWNENVFTFDFVAPGFRGGPGVSYSYRLVGAEENWTYSGTRHVASYGGLPPGNYRFEYRASIGDGRWSAPGKFSFIIHPPFWRTWWFIISVITISFLLVVIIVRRETTQRLRRQMLILEKQQAVERERNRISRDMHDDLGSGLTKIAILSEVVKKKISQNDPGPQKQVDIISESARELVDNLNEIIWALNPDNDNLSNLTAYIREYADRFLEPFDISLRCDFPDELPPLHLSEEKRRNLFLLVKEGLHNIVKHAQAKKVIITIRVENKTLCIEVRDDGRGFEESEVRLLGNGLKNMRKRAEAIGAELEMESSPGKGTLLRAKIEIQE